MKQAATSLYFTNTCLPTHKEELYLLALPSSQISKAVFLSLKYSIPLEFSPTVLIWFFNIFFEIITPYHTYPSLSSLHDSTGLLRDQKELLSTVIPCNTQVLCKTAPSLWVCFCTFTPLWVLTNYSSLQQSAAISTKHFRKLPSIISLKLMFIKPTSCSWALRWDLSLTHSPLDECNGRLSPSELSLSYTSLSAH